MASSLFSKTSFISISANKLSRLWLVQTLHDENQECPAVILMESSKILLTETFQGAEVGVPRSTEHALGRNRMVGRGIPESRHARDVDDTLESEASCQHQRIADLNGNIALKLAFI